MHVRFSHLKDNGFFKWVTYSFNKICGELEILSCFVLQYVKSVHMFELKKKHLCVSNDTKESVWDIKGHHAEHRDSSTR